MWLLKFHLCVSILCMITFIGFYKVFKSAIKEHGWLSEKKRSPFLKRMGAYLVFFVPILNLIFVLFLFVMIAYKKEKIERMCEEKAGDSDGH